MEVEGVVGRTGYREINEIIAFFNEKISRQKIQNFEIRSSISKITVEISF